MVAKLQGGHFKNPDGSVSVLPDPSRALEDYVHPHSGQSAARNVVRGDGLTSLDMAL